jgi:uroporphyrin-III C-methyltransferase
VSQERINELMVSRALAGRRVVRLKGGDPFVFGRGGEEAVACAAAGVPCEVVPGVSSAVAVPASAGIPVTHRGVSQQFTVVSGHVAPGDPSTVDWAGLARGGGTIVVLMGVTHLPVIASALVRGGRPPATPVAVVTAGTTPDEVVLTSTLAEVGADAAAAGVRPPAVVVVGEVVRLRDVLVGAARAAPVPASLPA